MNETVIVRPFNSPQDEAFLYASWRNALWYAEDRDDSLSEKFYRVATKEIRKLIDNPAVKVNIACMSNNADHIVGFSVFENKHLHWIYVKSDYRNSGIGRLLSANFETVAPPLTKFGRAIVINKELKVRYGKN